MLTDVLMQLENPPAQAELIVRSVATAGCVFLLVFLAVPKLRNMVLPPLVRSRLRDHILFDCVLADGKTIRCTDGALIRCIAVGGLDLTSMPSADQEDKYKRRCAWVEGLAEWPDVRVMIVTSRRLEERMAASERFENPQLERLHKTYQNHFQRGFRNTHTVVLWVPGGADKAKLALDQAINHTMTGLHEYRPAELRTGDSGELSPLLGFWAALLNPCRETTSVSVGDAQEEAGNMARAGWDPDEHRQGETRLADSITTARVCVSHGAGADAAMNFRAADETKYDDNGVVEFADAPGQSKFMGAVGVARHGPATSSAMTDAILSVPSELLMVHWVQVYDRADAVQVLNRKKKMTMGVFNSPGIEAEFQAAQQRIGVSNDLSLCKYQSHIFIFGDSADDLRRNLDAVRMAYGQFENRCVHCRDAVEPLYLSLFPPQIFWERPVDFTSENVADCISFETPLAGHARCDWGARPVSQFQTLRDTTFSFCWHKSTQLRDVGHTAVFGTTGSGKTFLTNFLATASLGYPDAHIFVFDRYMGACVPTRAFGGSYIHFDGFGGSTDTPDASGQSLNPLQMNIKNERIMSWLIRWFCVHVMKTDDPETEAAVTRTLAAMRDLSPSERTVKEFIKNIPQEAAGHKELSKLGEGGQYENMFGGGGDTLNMSASRYMTFDFTHVLEDEFLVRTVLPYVMFRIEQEMHAKNTPYLLLFDETHALLQEKSMRSWITQLLQEARKNRGVIVMCFQRIDSVTAFGESGILELVPTRIVLKNADANESDCMNILGLSRNDYNIVRGSHPSVNKLSHYALLKRGQGSVVLKTDMNKMLTDEDGVPLVPLFASGKTDADKVNHYARMYRDDPERWIRIYLDDVGKNQHAT